MNCIRMRRIATTDGGRQSNLQWEMVLILSETVNEKLAVSVQQKEKDIVAINAEILYNF